MEHQGKKEHTQKQPPERKSKEVRITLPGIKGVNLASFTAVAAAILLILVTFQAYQAFTLSGKVDELAQKAQEQNRLATLEVTAIEADCDQYQCASLAPIMAAVNLAKANITKSLTLSVSDERSKKLIADYSITRLPAIVVRGEIDRASLSLSGFTKKADALIYQSAAPYYDAESGKVKGVVTLTYVNVSSCEECQNLMPFVQQLSSQVKVGSLRTVDYDEADGKAIANNYKMARLPGILVSRDISEYPIGTQLAQLGTLKQDGIIALGANAPYLNISTGQVSGLTTLIILNDSSCKECYEPKSRHIPVLAGYGVYVKDTKIVDASSAEGKALIAKYSISSVPTILIKGDISPYAQFQQIWKVVGTTETDGTYIFRNMGAISGSTYKNLTTGKVEQNSRQEQQ